MFYGNTAYGLQTELLLKGMDIFHESYNACNIIKLYFVRLVMFAIAVLFTVLSFLTVMRVLKSAPMKEEPSCS